MKPFVPCATIFFFFALALTGVARADEIKLGLAVHDEGKTSFYLSLHTFYGTPDKAVVYAHKKGIPDEELPVLFYLSRKSGKRPEFLVSLRLKGKSWSEITLGLGLGAEIFYVPFKAPPGPPYGKAYGHFKNKPKKDWNKIVLCDADIVNLVNLKFMSEQYGLAPGVVVKMHAKHKSFLALNAVLKKNKKVQCKGKGPAKGKKNIPAKPLKTAHKAKGGPGKKGKK